MKQADLWKHKNDVKSLVKVHREHLSGASILHAKFDEGYDAIFKVSR